MTQLEIQHLFSRAGFGANIETIHKSLSLSRADIVALIYSQSSHINPLSAVQKPATEMLAILEEKRSKLNGGDRKMIREYETQQGKKLNIAWLKKMQSGEEMLNEKMTFFWHDHFACKELNPILSQQLNNTIRTHALGSFSSLLLAVSKEPAMLKYLNNQQNRKNAPNENFAREVMELFTLGRGRYTEGDVKEAARAFTGWAFDRRAGQFEFRPKQHDYDTKLFLGQSSTWDGTDIIRIITEQRICALFITDKIYRYFVNENGNDQRVKALATDFFNSGYDIGRLMEAIFLADWFYDAENVGTRIKSPIELIVSISRHFTPVYQSDQSLLLMQRVLGQILYSPPNVAGWPSGREWIDSSSLVFRLSLGRKIIESASIDYNPKPDNDANPNETFKKGKGYSQIAAAIDWAELGRNLSAHTDQELITKIAGYLIPCMNQNNPALTIDLSNISEPEKVKKVVRLITAMPEYQMC